MQPSNTLIEEYLWSPAVPQVMSGAGQNGGDADDKPTSWALVLMRIAAGYEYNRNIASVSTVAHHSLPAASARTSGGLEGVINAPEENGGMQTIVKAPVI